MNKPEYFKSVFPAEGIFNPYVRECIIDPYPAYQWMHQTGRTFSTPYDMPVVYKYDEAIDILRSGMTDKSPIVVSPITNKPLKVVPLPALSVSLF